MKFKIHCSGIFIYLIILGNFKQTKRNSQYGLKNSKFGDYNNNMTNNNTKYNNNICKH